MILVRLEIKEIKVCNLTRFEIVRQNHRRMGVIEHCHHDCDLGNHSEVPQLRLLMSELHHAVGDAELG
jgi:hypothetical protein